MSDWIKFSDVKPGNQKRVLVCFFNPCGKTRTTIAVYIEPKTVLADDFIDEDHWNLAEYDEKKDCYWTPGGFYEDQYETDINYRISETIEYWLSVPVSPLTTEKK